MSASPPPETLEGLLLAETSMEVLSMRALSLGQRWVQHLAARSRDTWCRLGGIQDQTGLSAEAPGEPNMSWRGESESLTKGPVSPPRAQPQEAVM